MKKYLLLIAILFSQYNLNAQTEYIDLTTKGIFGRSEMVVYNDITNYNDLEYLYIGRNNDNYHWVEYTNPNMVIVTMSDDPGDTREICTKYDDKDLNCEVVDAYATTYEFNAIKSKKFEIWISKPNVKL